MGVFFQMLFVDGKFFVFVSNSTEVVTQVPTDNKSASG